MSRLIQLYAELADLTHEICSTCSPPYHCCSEIGCWRATWFAKHAWRVELEPTGSIDHAMPYLTSTGCTVAPHHRPVCTIHLCPDRELPPRYRELVLEIAKLEGKH